MSERKSFNLGVVVGMLLLVGAQAIHWFISSYPDGSSGRVIGVALQAVVGFGTAAGLYLFHRRTARTADRV